MSISETIGYVLAMVIIYVAIQVLTGNGKKLLDRVKLAFTYYLGRGS